MIDDDEARREDRALPARAANDEGGLVSAPVVHVQSGPQKAVRPSRFYRQAILITLPLALMAIAPLVLIDLQPDPPRSSSYLVGKRSIPLPSVARALLPGAVTTPGVTADAPVMRMPATVLLDPAKAEPANTETVRRFELGAARASLLDLLLEEEQSSEQTQHAPHSGPSSVTEIEGFYSEFGE